MFQLIFFKCPLKKVVNVSTLGLLSQFLLGELGQDHVSQMAQPLVCLLQLSSRGRTRAAQALLKHMGICRLYPLVVVLFCLNDLKAKLLVEVDS